MTPHARLIQSARHTRKTLYLVAGFYVVVGFGVAVVAAIQGDRLGTFLGFLIVSGALALGLLFRAALLLGVRISAIGEGLDELRLRLDRDERLMRKAGTDNRKSVDQPAVSTLDLSDIGRGDPSLLVAATLDRDVYPRLVATMDEDPPAKAAETVPTDDVGTWGAAAECCEEPLGLDGPGPGEIGISVGLTTRSLLERWKIALRDGDLAGCRTVLSALIDTAGPEEVEPLRVQIAELSGRVERAFRAEFAASVRNRDYASAIAVGEHLCGLFPDGPIVEEFARLRPALERCAARDKGNVAVPFQAR